MDYEKAYKDALERAKREWSNNLDNAYKNYRERLEIIFPELKESDDEKIREAIINHLKEDIEIECILSKDEGYEWIAWLEKQCQTFTKKDVDDAYLKGVCDAKRELAKQCNNQQGKSALAAINDVPIDNANKVEPKFKEK